MQTNYEAREMKPSTDKKGKKEFVTPIARETGPLGCAIVMGLAKSFNEKKEEAERKKGLHPKPAVLYQTLSQHEKEQSPDYIGDIIELSVKIQDRNTFLLLAKMETTKDISNGDYHINFELDFATWELKRITMIFKGYKCSNCRATGEVGNKICFACGGKGIIES